VIVANNLEESNEQALGHINALAANLIHNYNARVVLLTSNPPQSAQAFAKKNNLVSELFYADGVPLKSMVRSNPGVMLLKNGVVVNKWHYHSLPKYEDLVKEYFSKQ
jgi:hypothetical protein